MFKISPCKKMISFIEKKNNDEEVFEELNPITAKWFRDKFKCFTESQKASIKPIKHRKNILISSPTGSGKTLCAFTSIIDYLIGLAESEELENKVYAVYVSPLKALSRDIEVNLKEPLEEIEKLSGKKLGIKVMVRTGDSSAAEKQKMVKKSPHILITTPESLAIILSTKKFIENFRAVEFVIIDEIHALASNKRGVHLSLSLERLEALSAIPPARIGLSATISPLTEVAKFLVGCQKEGKKWVDRECLIADVSFVKNMDLKVLSPVDDLINCEAEEMQKKLYSLIDELIQKHKTTLIFTNTRSATERVINHLKEMFPKNYANFEESIGAHHSSLSKVLRTDIEKKLREGKLKVCVTSTSLELGIDIGYIDLVILLGSPKSVARLIQRQGRSGHKLSETSKGRIIILDRDDLVESAVMLKEALNKKIDKIDIQKNCLDVLCQHIFGMAIQKVWDIDEIYNLIKQSYCYNELSYDDFFSVISYLAAEYSGLENKNVYAKIWFDSKERKIGKRGKLARMIYMTNVGTIPEEKYINVVAASPYERKDENIGVIDEAFLERLKKNDVFALGGQKYQFLYSKGMNIYVNASVKKSPTIPSWFSEMLPLSFDLALSIQHFRKLISDMLENPSDFRHPENVGNQRFPSMPKILEIFKHYKFSRMFENKKKEEKIKNFIENYLHTDKNSAGIIYNYFYEQYKYSVIPNESRIIIERWKDEGKNYCIFHTLYGRRVNDALSRALTYVITSYGRRDAEIGINDNGFYIAGNFPMQAEKALKFLAENPEKIKEILEEAVEKTEVFKRRFRHCAIRSLMILKNYKGKSKSVGKQQMKSHFLLSAVKKISKDFPILKETKREILEELMDVKNAILILDMIKNEKIEIKSISKEIPSPFSFNLITQSHTDLMKIEDKINFIKRMHKAVLEKIK